jgi:hypothetical protein
LILLNERTIMAKRKTWKQKLESGQPPHVEVLEKPFGGAMPGARMVIVDPRTVDAFMRAQPPGTRLSVADMRTALAQEAGADLTCPLTSGIFARIAAEAALDDLALGAPLETITPFWRVIEPKSPLAKKLSCGAEFVAERREAET